MIVTTNQAACCSGVNAKVFEILLIICSLCSDILLIVNLFVTKWVLRYSSSILAFEIILPSLNMIVIIFSFIISIWRCNGSVYNTHFYSSLCISNFILVILIINFISSIVEDVLFYYIYSIMSLLYDYILIFKRFIENDINFNEYSDIKKKIQSIEEKLEKKRKYYFKLMDRLKSNSANDILDDNNNDSNDNNNNDYNNYNDDYYDDTKLNILIKKLKILNILPWASFNFNIFMQFLMIIFIIIIKQRIYSRTDSGKQFNQNMLPSSFRNRMINKNSSITRNNNNIYNKNYNNYKNTNIKKKKKSKKKIAFSATDSAMANINKNKKKSKKAKH